MVKKINGRLFVNLAESKNENKKHFRPNIRLSLLSMLIGIFLLPNLAYLSVITPEEIIALTNKEREAVGLNALTANQLLTQAAIVKGKTILESQTFKHTIDNKKFSSWIRDAGYNYSYVGENLAIDFITSQGVVEAWNNSPMHKKNLLNPYYQEIGISVLEGEFNGQNTAVVVQIFGTPPIGSVQPLSLDPGLSYINSNMNFLETDFDGYRLTYSENLLTHSILNQKLLPTFDSKLVLPAENNLNTGSYKFIAQLKSYASANNILIIFASLTLIHILVFLYCYYFLKINKLASI